SSFAKAMQPYATATIALISVVDQSPQRPNPLDSPETGSGIAPPCTTGWDGRARTKEHVPQSASSDFASFTTKTFLTSSPLRSGSHAFLGKRYLAPASLVGGTRSFNEPHQSLATFLSSSRNCARSSRITDNAVDFLVICTFRPASVREA